MTNTSRAKEVTPTNRKQRRSISRWRGTNVAYDSAIKSEEEFASMPKLVDKYDAAKLLGLHPETVSRLARKGEIPGRIIGQRWVFSKRQLLAMVEGA